MNVLMVVLIFTASIASMVGIAWLAYRRLSCCLVLSLRSEERRITQDYQN